MPVTTHIDLYLLAPLLEGRARAAAQAYLLKHGADLIGSPTTPAELEERASELFVSTAATRVDWHHLEFQDGQYLSIDVSYTITDGRLIETVECR